MPTAFRLPTPDPALHKLQENPMLLHDLADRYGPAIVFFNVMGAGRSACPFPPCRR
ncbi:MAG: hypothetical protein CBARDMAM_0072 [uncultured Caballeronia sp.]|nr:MAG: hypothetical protein CBARDMAM_0072 [uncultured Caballeronia sp.]